MPDREHIVQLFQSPKNVEDLTAQVRVLRALVLRLVQEVEVLRERSASSGSDGAAGYV